MKNLVILISLLLTACYDESAGVDNRPVVFIGDSIIFRWDLDAKDLSFVNVGIGSQRTREMLARFDRDVLALNPRLVVIEGGIVDLFYDTESTTASLEEMAARAASAGATVAMLSVLPYERAVPDEKVRAFNARLRNFAAGYGHRFVDFDPVMRDADGRQRLELFLEDGVHPNADGYATMWPVLQPALRHGTP